MDDETARAPGVGGDGENQGDAEVEVVRTTDSPTKAGDWDLVLASAGIPRRLVQREGAFALLVPARDGAAAREALTAFDAESAPVALAPPLDLGPSALGIAFATILVGFFVAARGWDEAAAPATWVQAGYASAEHILRGEWWRAVTALTLHEDVFHLVTNVIGSLLFVSAVGRWLGAGPGGALILVSAMAANLLDAAVHRTAFVSLGASTAVFAALGNLVGLQLVRRWQNLARRRYAWVPLGAGLGLYAMLGAGRQGQHIDWQAHLFGLGLGVVAGTAVAGAGVRPPGRLAQAALAVVVLGALAGCWFLALRGA